MKRINKIGLTFALLLIGGGILAGCTMLPAETQVPNQPPVSQPDQPGQDTGSEPPATQPSSGIPTPYDASSQRAPEAIFIAAPGPQSRVTSPLVVEGIADSALGSSVTVQLFQMSDTGSMADALLTEQTAAIQPQMGTTGPFRVELSFTPRPSNDIGWVMVSLRDPEDGGLVHASTAQVTLLTAGAAEIAMQEQSAETIEIQYPTPGQEISGGSVEIIGFSEYFFEANVGVLLCWTEAGVSGNPHEICGTGDQIIAQGNLMIDSPDMGMPGPFSGRILYDINRETPARLVLFALSPRDGSILHLSSVEVLLKP